MTASVQLFRDHEEIDQELWMCGRAATEWLGDRWAAEVQKELAAIAAKQTRTKVQTPHRGNIAASPKITAGASTSGPPSSAMITQIRYKGL